jgi:hypothetical protein
MQASSGASTKMEKERGLGRLLAEIVIGGKAVAGF